MKTDNEFIKTFHKLQIIKVLDIDLNGVVILNEVLAASDDVSYTH